MTEIRFRDDFDVELVQHCGSDSMICQSARVSTAGEDADPKASKGLINSLMKNRHGSPFEHSMMTFQISAPIFVWREFMRHRIASYSEESARYREMKPVFYIPSDFRPLVQVGKPMDYTMLPGDDKDFELVTEAFIHSMRYSWNTYELLLEKGIAREVARDVLPVSIYSTARVSMNLRGLMNFLSLRVNDPGSTFESKPLWEIQKVALQMEDYFADYFPITYNAFNDNGRVAP